MAQRHLSETLARTAEERLRGSEGMQPSELKKTTLKVASTIDVDAPPALQQLREWIDTIDDEIIRLILKRIEVSTLIMKTKPPAQIVDPHREQAIASRYFEKLSGVSTGPKSARLVLGIIGASKLYPENCDSET